MVVAVEGKPMENQEVDELVLSTLAEMERNAVRTTSHRVWLSICKVHRIDIPVVRLSLRRLKKDKVQSQPPIGGAGEVEWHLLPAERLRRGLPADPYHEANESRYRQWKADQEFRKWRSREWDRLHDEKVLHWLIAAFVALAKADIVLASYEDLGRVVAEVAGRITPPHSDQFYRVLSNFCRTGFVTIEDEDRGKHYGFSQAGREAYADRINPSP